MQTAPGHVTAYRRTINQESDPHDGAELAPQTPAERIALTMALLNRGLDLLDGVVRTFLAGCARGAFEGRRDAALPRRPHSADRFSSVPRVVVPASNAARRELTLHDEPARWNRIV
jgi:hypothetical protein